MHVARALSFVRQPLSRAQIVFSSLTQHNSNCRAMSSLMRSDSYINGQWVKSRSGKTFEVLNPANGKVLGEVSDFTADDLDSAIGAAYEAFKSWSQLTAKERGGYLTKWFELINQNSEELGKLMSLENGKPLAEAKGEVSYAASFVEWYAAEGRRNNGDVIEVPATNRRVLVRKEPIGVAGIIIPWNFPAAMLTRKIAPALAVGCTVVVKTPEDTPYTPTALTELAEKAGFPKGVINVISCSRSNTSDIGKMMCSDRRVGTVSFTGSCEVGKALMSLCSQHIKKVSLELGGLAPFIVFDSADLGKVEPAVRFAKYRNAGQACISAQNFFVQEGIYDKAVELFVNVTKSLKLGDPLQPGTTIGPLINQKGLDKVDRLVEDAKAKGAKVLVGGYRAKDVGDLYYQPTVLVDVTDDMDIVHEEVFGPVISVIKFKSEEEALQKANRTDRGLAGYFFSSDMSQCFRVMESLQMGLIGCNEGAISACEVPFGGYKESGIGREGGHYGLDEFLQVKMCALGL